MTQKEFDESVQREIARLIRRASESMEPDTIFKFPIQPCESMEFKDGRAPDGGHVE